MCATNVVLKLHSTLDPLVEAEFAVLAQEANTLAQDTRRECSTTASLDLRELSRVYEGPLDLRFEPVDLDNIAREVAVGETHGTFPPQHPPPPHDSTGHTWHHPDQLLLALIRVGIGLPLTSSDRLGVVSNRIG